MFHHDRIIHIKSLKVKVSTFLLLLAQQLYKSWKRGNQWQELEGGETGIKKRSKYRLNIVLILPEFGQSFCRHAEQDGFHYPSMHFRERGGCQLYVNKQRPLLSTNGVTISSANPLKTAVSLHCGCVCFQSFSHPPMTKEYFHIFSSDKAQFDLCIWRHLILKWCACFMHYKAESLQGLPGLQEDSKLDYVFCLRDSNRISLALLHFKVGVLSGWVVFFFSMNIIQCCLEIC